MTCRGDCGLQQPPFCARPLCAYISGPDPDPYAFCLPNSRGGKDPLSSPGGPGSRRSNYNLGMYGSIWKNLDESVRVWARAPRTTWGRPVRSGG